jgi:hypothetical protein
MLVGCAGHVGWKSDVSVLKRVFLITSFGRIAMAVLVALTSLTACLRPTPTQQITLRIGVLRIQDDLPYFVMQEQGFAKLESMQPTLAEIGLLKAPVPVNQLYDETLLKEVLAEKR